MYAARQNRSLSDLIENYLKTLTETGANAPDELTPAVRSLMGSFKASAGFDYKEVLREERIKKHG